jgi:hypothetical protein
MTTKTKAGERTAPAFMTALSLWQPWATLVAISAKEMETRGRWLYTHRGELAIHAAKRWTRDLAALCELEPFRSVLTAEALKHWPDIPGDRAVEGRKALHQYLRHAGRPKGLPLGSVVARTLLNNVFRTEKVLPLISEQERAFGDYSPGRRAIELGPTVALPSPIPYRGTQGLFRLDEETAARVRELAPFPWERVLAHA